MMTVLDFFARRKRFGNEYFPCPGGRKTVLVTSHAWWTELIAHALLRCGCNVLVAEPWSQFWTDNRRWVTFDAVFNQWVQTIRKFNVQLVIGADDAAMVPHARTRELLHRRAGV